MEGPLCKWTNVMKGWQYRWFVLQPQSGLLSYFTSKEKMMKGSRRGCVRLNGAVVGIDDDDDSTFTVTVESKTYHFQAQNPDEKEKWLDALDEAINRESTIVKQSKESWESFEQVFKKRLVESDAYLQILLQQVQNIGSFHDECEDQEKFDRLNAAAETIIEGVKKTLVLLQICKENVYKSLCGTPTSTILLDEKSCVSFSMSGEDDKPQARMSASPSGRSLSQSLPNLNAVEVEDEVLEPSSITTHSTTSSDDEDFFDAPEADAQTTRMVIAPQDDVFDELYDDPHDDALESLDQHGSVITHLLSQVKIGMDLTKIVLPTFILERRSLLEMYADFLAHPDLFVCIAEGATPTDRLVACTRWYLSAFHAGRHSPIAKKPYNPILGETFKGFYQLPTTQPSGLHSDGPVPWASKSDVTFIAEQVSHHPPISAFYAEHFDKRISLDGYIWTKSKFLGLSIGVHMIGQTVVSLVEHDEDYVFTFPNAYGRSILTVPWVELGGKTSIVCAKTGCHTEVEFHAKPFYGGKKNLVSAELYLPKEKKSFCSIQGEWNGKMHATYHTGPDAGVSRLFLDTKAMPILKKTVQPLEKQLPTESRRLWMEVTRRLKERNVELATVAKQALEETQREQAKARKQNNIAWKTKYFHEVGEHWVYYDPLCQRSNQK